MQRRFFVLAILAAGFLFLSGVNGTHAAVTASSTALSTNAANTATKNSSFGTLSIDLFPSGADTLSSVTVTVATTTQVASSTAISSSSFNWLGLFQDATSTGQVGRFDSGDLLLATSSVNINATTTITAPANIPAAGIYFVVLRTSNSWTDNGAPETGGAVTQQVTVGIGASGINTSSGLAANNATTTSAFVADIHSQTPNATKISTSYNSSGGTYSISDTNNAGGIGEAGTLNVYSTSTANAAPFATGSLSSAGQANISLGTTYYPSIWLDANDLAGNATSSKVQFNLSTFKPSVTSFYAFTDRIILNTSKSLNGMQATMCSNYLVNGSAPNCGGGPGSPYIDFQGTQLTIHNLSLSGTASFTITGLIQDNTSDQFPLTFSTSSVSVSTASVPTINSISPSSGKVGDTVTITGTNFGTATGTVTFSSGFDSSTGPKPPITASTTSWSATSITAVVPTGAQGGPVQVISSSGLGSDMNPNTFFDVLGNAYFKFYLGSSTSTVVDDPANMRIFIGNPNGMNIYASSSGAIYDPTNKVYEIDAIPGMGFVWALMLPARACRQ